MLRIATDGTGAPGNAGSPFRPEAYTDGHRNVPGPAFAPDGRAYPVEHGPDRDDEVDLGDANVAEMEQLTTLTGQEPVGATQEGLAAALEDLRSGL